ncbi:acetylornithine deacetylase [Gallaecimonas kandeliae]|uniref:acetylornithine deacetylase n=1 Tax=Gallaecimonas kandeliae TaxID=3029055 RepID=UPI00264A1D9D|nr:acetylornithine deacetylase [Gallaecimonas kandeliae]WKE65299.1 acetylornithine deacetylase [Gallaecimonas kandeliae]
MSRLPSLDQMFNRLLSLPSVSATDPALDTGNKAVIEQLAQWCETLGFKVTLQPVGPNKLNLWAELGSGPGGLLLTGHADTVPFDEGRWQKNPLGLTERDGRWYGLGATDMKGFFALVLGALETMDLSQLKAPLRIAATADEETTMDGARLLAEANPFSPALTLVGEPTELKPIGRHKGHISAGIRITGRSGHSSDPAAGLNAMELMHGVMGDLIALKGKLAERYQDNHFAVPYPTLNLGHIHGGDNANRICGCCELHIDIRPLPGMSIPELEGLLKESLSNVEKAHPGALAWEHLHAPCPAFVSPPGPFQDEIGRLLQSPVEAANYATEAPFFASLGGEVLVLGPGSIRQAHQPDEYLAMDQLRPAMELIQSMVKRLCLA